MEFIRIENVSYVYRGDRQDDVGALNDISLSIPKGQFVCIIGHNGSGKSTLAKHLNGLLLPTSGRVIIDGMNTHDPESLWPVRQKVGMVFQNPDNQIVATTVEEDVAFGPENLGIPPSEIRHRIDKSLDIVGMSDFKTRQPHQLSGGQKQRVAIAGVLSMNTECIVLDEPTAMLDPSGRSEVISTITRLNKDEGKTIVLITHFMNEAAGADRVIVMERGRIAMDGAPDEVFSDVERLRALYLDVPQVCQLVYGLRENGVVIPVSLTIDGVFQSLKRLLLSGEEEQRVH